MFFYNKKFRHLVSIFLILFVISGCATGIKTSDTTPLELDSSVVTGTLSNGMDFFIKQNSEPENRIMLRLVVDAGSNMEDDDQQGVAHLLEHMAFNGTEHFAENQLVDYFESIGMAFGPEVNAYTSFDETVYMLEVPADDPKMLLTGLTVLRDWACAITLDAGELDKERGVVTEEWRLGRGLSGRKQDVQIPFLLKDSRYAERLPIGKMDVIANIPRQRVLDFYKKWYRPDLMSVVLVGDADSQYLKQVVEDVMSDIPAATEENPRIQYNVKPQTEEAVLVFKDAEQPYTLIQILEQIEYEPLTVKGQFRQSLVATIASSILNGRFAEITQSGNAPWLDAASFSQNITRTSMFNALGMIPLTGNFNMGFTALLDELIRYQKYGAIQNELERVVQNIYKSAEQQWLNRSKKNSGIIASELVDYALTGNVMIDADLLFSLYKEVLPTITLKEVNAAAKNMFTNRGVLLIAAVPMDAKDVPSQEALLEFWQTYESAEPLLPYTEDSLKSDWAIIPEKKGSVVAQEKVPGTDVVKYTLSNGAELFAMKTDFKNNEILFSAISKGGLSLLSDEQVPSASMVSDFVDLSGLNGFTATELQKVLAGKNVALNSFIGEYTEGLSGKSSTSDLETLMQLVYLSFTEPDFTEAGWNTMMNSVKTMAESRSLQPFNVFKDKLVELIYGKNLRKSAVTPEYVSYLDKNLAEKIYKERFANAGDFAFIFVGDFEEKELLNLAETYIATLPSLEEPLEQAIWQEKLFPKGKPAATVRKGLEDQSRVFIAFGGELPVVSAKQANIDAEMLKMLEMLLDIRLREVIREEKGGSYGVSVYASMRTMPKRNFMVQINFGCKPGREQELADEVLVQIRKLQTELLDESYMIKLRETYRRELETAVKTNSFWLSAITDSVLTDLPLETVLDAETIPALISAQTLRQLANEYLDLDNYVIAYLMPEK
ncbi:MAG: insulinase family protein [Spirochaetaceae bacterium]|nr:insulinase family protein [Spirochaetaceae bacterium]